MDYNEWLIPICDLFPCAPPRPVAKIFTLGDVTPLLQTLSDIEEHECQTPGCPCAANEAEAALAKWYETHGRENSPV